MTKGKCLCGSVEIETKGESLATVACSCTSCQSCSGSAFTINLVYPKGTVDVVKGAEHKKVYTGRSLYDGPRTFTYPYYSDKPLTQDVDTGESGNDVFRNFCGNCGTAIYTETIDGMLFVKVSDINPSPISLY
jgi:hypothetical protein